LRVAISVVQEAEIDAPFALHGVPARRHGGRVFALAMQLRELLLLQR
jgi:hypothetical protein